MEWYFDVVLISPIRFLYYSVTGRGSRSMARSCGGGCGLESQELHRQEVLHEYRYPENEPGEVQAYFERLSEENAVDLDAGMYPGSPPAIRKVDGEVAAPRRGGSSTFPQTRRS
jgi:hypothetical protein